MIQCEGRQCGRLLEDDHCFQRLVFIVEMNKEDEAAARRFHAEAYGNGPDINDFTLESKPMFRGHLCDKCEAEFANSVNDLFIRGVARDGEDGTSQG